MFNKTRSGLAWLAALLVIGVLGLTACTSTPLPPLFVARGSATVAPAAAAPMVVTPVVAASEAETATEGEAETTVEAVAVQPGEAAPVSAAITQTAELTATAVVAVEVRAAEAVTVTTPITSTAAITSSRMAEVAVAAAPPTPTATRAAPTPTRRAPAATRVAPTATRALPTATRAPVRPTATPTPQWPKTLVITSDDIEQGATSVPGLQISGLDVQFGNNTMTMSFDSLRYSFVSMRNVTIEGRFVVNNCDVDFVADRITPRNLATGAIPGFINQSLDQQLGAWCVESLAVQPDQLVASVRPR
jgi:hypothetical protein